MIDIHNHIIFDCDDGSKSIEQSVCMIEAARNIGITDICCTPHYMDDGYKSDRHTLEEKLERIKLELMKSNINVNLYLGEEVFIFPNLPQQLDKIACLNDSRYLLFEIPLVEEANYIFDVIYRLISAGKVPVLAHPERYYVVYKNYDFLKELREKGVLFQININSLSRFLWK